MLDDLTQALELVRLPQSARDALDSMQPRAEIRDLRLRLEIGDSGSPIWAAQGRVSGLHSASWGKIPAIDGANLHLWADQDRGTLELDSADLGLTFPGLLRHTLVADRAQGLLRWHRHQDGTLVLDADELLVDTPHIKTRSRLSPRAAEARALSVSGLAGGLPRW